MASTSEDREENLDGNEKIEENIDEQENADEGFNGGNPEEITPRVNFISVFDRYKFLYFFTLIYSAK